MIPNALGRGRHRRRLFVPPEDRVGVYGDKVRIAAQCLLEDLLVSEDRLERRLLSIEQAPAGAPSLGTRKIDSNDAGAFCRATSEELIKVRSGRQLGSGGPELRNLDPSGRRCPGLKGCAFQKQVRLDMKSVDDVIKDSTHGRNVGPVVPDEGLQSSKVAT